MPADFPQFQFLKSAASPGDFPASDRAEVAFAGRSNAGKSSALNALAGQKALARVSKTPGRTQLINFFDAAAGRLVDLPGYGYAKVPQGVRRGWNALIGSYVERRERLRGIVLIVDIRRLITDFDVQMLDWAGASGRPSHVLLTKADKLSYGAAKAGLLAVQRQLGGSASAQLFSAVSRQGLDEARGAVTRWLAEG